MYLVYQTTLNKCQSDPNWIWHGTGTQEDFRRLALGYAHKPAGNNGKHQTGEKTIESRCITPVPTRDDGCPEKTVPGVTRPESNPTSTNTRQQPLRRAL